MSTALITMVRQVAQTLGFGPHEGGALGEWKGVLVSAEVSHDPSFLRVRADLLEPLDLDLEVRSWRAGRQIPEACTYFQAAALGRRFYVSALEPARASALFTPEVAHALVDGAEWRIMLTDFGSSIEVTSPVPDSVPLAIRCVSRVVRRVNRARRAVPPPAWGRLAHAAMSEVARRMGLEVWGCPLTFQGDVGEISVLGAGGAGGEIRLTARSRDGAAAAPGRAPSPAMLPLIRDLQQRGGLGFDADQVAWTSGPQVSGADLGLALEMLVSLARKWFGLEDGGPYR